MAAIQYTSVKLHFLLYSELDNHSNLDRSNIPLRNPELLTPPDMSILGFYLCKICEFWFSLWHFYITEHLCEYGMSKPFQVHVTNLQGQPEKNSLIMETLLALFV